MRGTEDEVKLHRGDGGNLWARADGEHTSVASLEYTLVLVSVAVPAMESPPPCQPREQGQPPLGRWMKVQGKFKMQAHPSSGVVMDIAAFKVSHSVGPDSHATALRAARTTSASIIGAMERYVCGFNSAQNSRCPATIHSQQCEHTIGAMDESSGNIQDASTPKQSLCCHGYCSLQS